MPGDLQVFDMSRLEALGAAPKFFDAGEKVFLADDGAAVMYVVRSGRIDVLNYGAVLENVRAGGMIGEMALIDDGFRSAAAIAVEPTQVYQIDKALFLNLVRDHPDFALAVMRQLAARIRRMNDNA